MTWSLLGRQVCPEKGEHQLTLPTALGLEMIKTKEYRNVRFSEDILREAARVFREQVPAQTQGPEQVSSDVAEVIRKYVPAMTRKQSEQAVHEMAKALFGDKPGCSEHTTTG
jgi:hypothetical protein